MAITKQEIWNVADQLDEKGVKPTLAAIRQAVGSGSYTTISEAMKEWREKHATESAPIVDPMPEPVKQALLDAGARLWEQTLTHADARWQVEREERDSRISALEQQLAESGELADTLAEEAEQAEKLKAHVDELTQQNERLSAQVPSLEEENQNVKAELEPAHGLSWRSALGCTLTAQNRRAHKAKWRTHPRTPLWRLETRRAEAQPRRMLPQL